ncbi:hypothetical protein, partial [Sphingobium sp. WCS2017Hpa-17]|uniref:hypothetical protein n=1 Tax=Sphingobium sp. WCS2017Hpa-17 TaxID=3073638 RepID=UPI00288B5498
RQRRPRCRVNVIAEPALNLAIFRPVFGAHQAMVGVLAFAGFRHGALVFAVVAGHATRSHPLAICR